MCQPGHVWRQAVALARIRVGDDKAPLGYPSLIEPPPSTLMISEVLVPVVGVVENICEVIVGRKIERRSGGQRASNGDRPGPQMLSYSGKKRNMA